jgi:hypothetical protein
MRSLLLAFGLLSLAAFAPAQHANSHLGTSPFHAGESQRDLDKIFRKVRQPSQDMPLPVQVNSRQRRRHDYSGFGRHRGFHGFEHLVLVSDDTNYALHGAGTLSGSFSQIMYQDPEQMIGVLGVYAADNCSSHAYAPVVRLASIKFGDRRCRVERPFVYIAKD